MLTALSILGVLVALFLAAALATRDSQALAPAAPDAADLDLTSPATAESVRSVRFGLALRGYRMSEVDAVLEQLAEDLEQRDRRIAELERASSGGTSEQGAGEPAPAPGAAAPAPGAAAPATGAGAPATDAAFGGVAPAAGAASSAPLPAEAPSAPGDSPASTPAGGVPGTQPEDLPSGPPAPPREADPLPADPAQVRTP